MSGSTLALVTQSPEALTWPWVQEVLGSWSGDQRPQVCEWTLAEVLQDPRLLDRSAVLWAVLSDQEARAVADLIYQVQERDIGAMFSRPAETRAAGSVLYEGVVAGPPDAGAVALCAVLRALLSQAALVRSLRTELQIFQAHQLGLCDQMGKIDEELRMAAQLQREFLPTQLPSIEGIEFQVLYRPATYVSGDIYDIERLDEDHVGFFVADAVGHGVPAALMTMYIKRSMRCKEIDPSQPNGYRIISPDAALARLNHDMVGYQNGRVRTATACYGVLNFRTLELQFARAGHPFPMILRGDGRQEMVEPDGSILGVFPEEQFELATTRLEAGDRVLLYSDGFEVAFPDRSDPAGRIANDQYTQEFKDLARGPLAEAVQRLRERLDTQSGSLNQRDDLTVVCLGVDGAPQV